MSEITVAAADVTEGNGTVSEMLSVVVGVIYLVGLFIQSYPIARQN